MHWLNQLGFALLCLCLVIVIQARHSVSSTASDAIWGPLFGAVLTDREKADVLGGPNAEPEDHFGNVQYFKRYILSHPKRIA